MIYLISVLVIIVCVLLVLIVLIQNPKGGLTAAFSTNNQVMGVRKTTDFLEKATWTMGIALVVLSIASSAFNTSSTTVDEEIEAQSKMTEQIDAKALPSAPINNGVPLPDNGTPTPEDK
ncbi:MAG: preprotein translocase subunit SecG [Flavobacteriales bacterium CG_4_10_14_0_2_um_filter_32_8]|nr:MAG: preprotein translocase subunit SecG [Flavobacteriales bacterium CG_4_10_14_0_2_um_filter_32_8]PJB15547.1 MAG: preprotein translocase subunit SecG [Flavobacteriales bacterium CG_4_9_14_3_um_filter_32_8]